MTTRGKLQFAGQALLTLMALAFAETGIAGPLITQTDSFGVIYTLLSDNVKQPTCPGGFSCDVYDLFIIANALTSDLPEHAYISDITVQANATLLSPNRSRTGTVSPDGVDFRPWTNMLGGQNSNMCNGSEKDKNFDCAHFSPDFGANLASGILELEFALSFPVGTNDPLSFALGGSHLKVNYFGLDNTPIGQTDIAATINGPPSTTVPEPGSLALLGALALGFGITKKLRQGGRTN